MVSSAVKSISTEHASAAADGCRLIFQQVLEAVLAPRQELLKEKDRLYAARAFFEALQLQKDKKVCCFRLQGYPEAPQHDSCGLACVVSCACHPGQQLGPCLDVSSGKYLQVVVPFGYPGTQRITVLNGAQVKLTQEEPLGPIVVAPAANWERRHSLALQPSQRTAGFDSESQLV